MKFLCDVHISFKLVTHLRILGYETIHINEILNKSETLDGEICNYADEHNFIVLTKDADFRNLFFIKSTPKKLIKVNLGNIPNSELIRIISDNLPLIEKLYQKSNFLMEVDSDYINVIEME